MTADAAIGDAAASDLSSAGFSADQLEDSVAAADGQAAWLAWITSTTGETRDFARRQLVLVQTAYVVAVAAIDWISGKLRFAIIGPRALA